MSFFFNTKKQTMNIKARINARKIVLLYFYQRHFAESLVSDEKKLDKYLQKDLESDNKVKFFADDQEIYNLINKWISEDSDIYENNEDKLNQIKSTIVENYTDFNIESTIAYIVESGFSKMQEQGLIDFDYIWKVVNSYSKYLEEVEQKVNKYVENFNFSEMDIMDRAIFVLGYVEAKECGTDKLLVLNEMIELAKRYWDTNSFKLINAIWHKILTDEE